MGPLLLDLRYSRGLTGQLVVDPGAPAAAKAEEASTLLLKLGGRVMPEQFDDASDDAALAA